MVLALLSTENSHERIKNLPKTFYIHFNLNLQSPEQGVLNKASFQYLEIRHEYILFSKTNVCAYKPSFMCEKLLLTWTNFS